MLRSDGYTQPCTTRSKAEFQDHGLERHSIVKLTELPDDHLMSEKQGGSRECTGEARQALPRACPTQVGEQRKEGRGRGGRARCPGLRRPLPHGPGPSVGTREALVRDGKRATPDAAGGRSAEQESGLSDRPGRRPAQRRPGDSWEEPVTRQCADVFLTPLFLMRFKYNEANRNNNKKYTLFC